MKRKNRFRIFMFILCLTTFGTLHAQVGIEWQKCLGGSSGDWAQSIRRTNDNGFIVAGYSLSGDGDATANYGNDDFWVVKLDSAGSIQWQRNLGGSGFDESYSIQQTSDSGYIVAGFTTSNDSDVTGNHGSDDCWIVKLDMNGGLQWQRALGGSDVDDAFAVHETNDRGYLVAGNVLSNDGDVSGNHGAYDAWVAKLDSAGNLVWQKSFGGSADDGANSIDSTPDGGYVIVGSTKSNDGDVSGNHGDWDYWIMKLDSIGNLEWQQCKGGSGEDIGYSVRCTADSGFIVTGFSKSNDGEVNGHHGVTSLPDYWVVKLDSAGNMQWQKSLGGTDDDKAYSIVQSRDGGFLTAGYSKSNNGDVSGNHSTGIHDYWLVKLDSTGNLQWQMCAGGSGSDWARSVVQITDSNYVVAGFTASVNGDITNNHGNNDFWILKLGLNTGLQEEAGISMPHVSPNPTHGEFTVVLNSIHPNAQLQIVNALGQTMRQVSLVSEQTVVDLSAYPDGLYYVRVSDDNQSWVDRIILTK